MSNLVQFPKRKLSGRELEIKNAIEAEIQAEKILNDYHGFYWFNVRGFDVNKLRRYSKNYRNLSEEDKNDYCRYVAENEEKFPMNC